MESLNSAKNIFDQTWQVARSGHDTWVVFIEPKGGEQEDRIVLAECKDEDTARLIAALPDLRKSLAETSTAASHFLAASGADVYERNSGVIERARKALDKTQRETAIVTCWKCQTEYDYGMMEVCPHCGRHWLDEGRDDGV